MKSCTLVFIFEQIAFNIRFFVSKDSNVLITNISEPQSQGLPWHNQIYVFVNVNSSNIQTVSGGQNHFFLFVSFKTAALNF